MPLLPLLKINKDAISNELEEIKLNLHYGSTEELADNIRSIPKDIIKYSLSEWGIKKEVLPSLVEQSFTKDRMENNIKDLSKVDVEIILKEIF